jgi:hypothetical protein
LPDNAIVLTLDDGYRDHFKGQFNALRAGGDSPERLACVGLYRGRGFARAVGSACSGSSGQKCFGYWPRRSARTAA